jgi:hypothetical protein
LSNSLDEEVGGVEVSGVFVGKLITLGVSGLELISDGEIDVGLEPVSIEEVDSGVCREMSGGAVADLI